MQSPFISLSPAPSNKKSLVLAAVGVIAVVGVIYACFGAPTTTETGFNLVVASLPFDQVPPTYIMEAFAKWEAKHNKTYLSGSERLHRMKVFETNVKLIKEHMDKGGDVKLALNSFADLSRAEFKARYLSLDQRAMNSNRTKNVVVKNATALPDKVDWRDKGAVTGIKDQKQCGSCWAFSATGAMEGVFAAKNGSLKSFSEQQLVDCSGSEGNEGCNGGLMDYAFSYVQKKGIQSETSYPYTARDGTCKYDPSKVEIKISGFTDVAANDEDQLAAAVVDHPVAVAIEADSIVFQFYSSGVIDSKSCGTDLDHGVLAVGYDATAPKNYWIVKNSWGTGWGDKGYVKILKVAGGKSAGICGIAEMASYPNL